MACPQAPGTTIRVDTPGGQAAGGLVATRTVHLEDQSITLYSIHPGYREKFADNLKRELPRIPPAPPCNPNRDREGVASLGAACARGRFLTGAVLIGVGARNALLAHYAPQPDSPPSAG